MGKNKEKNNIDNGKKILIFNLDMIKESLMSVYKNFNYINSQLENKREKMTKEVIDNIILAYNYLNDLLKNRIDLLSPAGLFSILELNHIVLCGIDPAKRLEYHNHIIATREKFQKNIKKIIKWYKEKGKDLKPYKKATRFYILSLSQPQLFIEGNHRTGNILLNYLLITEDKPPFIIDCNNAKEYFEPSGKIKYSNKEDIYTRLLLHPKYEKEFIEFLEKNSSFKYIKGL